MVRTREGNVEIHRNIYDEHKYYLKTYAQKP